MVLSMHAVLANEQKHIDNFVCRTYSFPMLAWHKRAQQ